MERTNKHTVLKEVRDNNIWVGYISPSNVNSFHIKDGWHIGHEILITIGRDKDYYVVSRVSNQVYNEYEKLETYLNNFKYYNCNSELGQRISFWVD